jgi:chemotaxis protein methyltransferase CheR
VSRDKQTEAVEVDLLLEGLARRYGYDFSGYARPTLSGRVRQAMLEEGLTTVSALQERVLHDLPSMHRFVERLVAQPTSMFPNPDRYLTLRREVVPLLRTYPFVRVWHAGCASGEEVFSTAILLHEEGLLKRSRLHGTDVSESIIERARAGAFPLSAMRDDEEAYQRAGCRQELAAYYTVEGQAAVMQPWLRRNVVFSQHNLVCDGVFNEFQLVVCRNVLTSFDQALRDRVHEVLYRSLCTFGILGIGSRESLRGTPFEDSYQEVGVGVGLYRRIH